MAGRTSALALVALALARRIDAGADDGSLVALVREHRATLAAAIQRTPAADAVDELRARREARKTPRRGA